MIKESKDKPIRIYSMGNLEIHVLGRPIRYFRKRPMKPLNLLMALLSQNGKNVSIAYLAETVWPEASGDTALKTFDVTLHRLRRLVGNNWAFLLEGGMLSINDDVCWVDIWEINRILERIRVLWNASSKAMACKLTRNVVDAYRGDFLASGGLICPQITYMSESLKNRVLTALDRAGMHHEHEGQYKKAIGLYERGIEIEPLYENFYQRIMLCLCRLGKRAEALVYYNRLHDILDKNGLEPSAITRKIHNSVLLNLVKKSSDPKAQK